MRKSVRLPLILSRFFKLLFSLAKPMEVPEWPFIFTMIILKILELVYHIKNILLCETLYKYKNILRSKL